MKISAALATFVGVAVGGIQAVAADVAVTAVQTAPVLDGLLDDAAWREATSLGVLRQVSPIAGAEASVGTTIQLLQDGRTLFVGIVASDGGKRIARQVARDTDLGGDDHVTLVLDPSGARRNGYAFRVNANGAQQDSLIFDGDAERKDWDGIWSVSVQTTEEGWSAELAIPFATISGAGEGDWGLNFERYRADTGEVMRWHGIQVERDIVSVRDAGRVRGLPSSVAGSGIRLKLSARLEDNWSARDEVQSGELELQPSLDLFWRLRSDSTATLTLNTDFAEAEADERQVNLSRFPLFLPEKREFFLQDAGVFSFGGLQDNLLPFFSRRVGLTEDGMPLDLDGGLKLTHESQAAEAGLLVARVDRSPSTDAADIAVGRVAARVGRYGRLGAIATSGNPQGTDGSHTWGIDWQYRNQNVDGHHALAIDAWTQTTRSMEAGEGRAHGLSVDWPNLGFTGNVSAARIETAYAPALGFVAETGIDQAFGELGYWRRFDSGSELQPQIEWEWSEGIDDPRGFSSIAPEIYFGSVRGDYLVANISTNRERLIEDFEILPGLVIPAGSYRYDRWELEAGLAASRVVSGEMTFSAGQFYDGRRRDIGVEIDLRSGALWGVSLRGEQTHLNLPARATDIYVAAFRLNITPTPRIAASVLLQWDDVTDELGASLRARWTVVAGRDLYLSLNRLFDDPRRATTLADQRSLKLAWNWQW